MTNIKPIPFSELNRLKAARDIKAICRDYGDILNEIVFLAAEKLRCKNAAITIVDHEEVEFIATFDMELSTAHREHVICSQAVSTIESADPNKRLFEVKDSLLNESYKNTLFVQGKPFLRSYLGYAIQVQVESLVMNIGTLCVCDNKPRSFSGQEKFDLKVLGEISNKILTGDIHINH